MRRIPFLCRSFLERKKLFRYSRLKQNANKDLNRNNERHWTTNFRSLEIVLLLQKQRMSWRAQREKKSFCCCNLEKFLYALEILVKTFPLFFEILFVFLQRKIRWTPDILNDYARLLSGLKNEAFIRINMLFRKRSQSSLKNFSC